MIISSAAPISTGPNGRWLDDFISGVLGCGVGLGDGWLAGGCWSGEAAGVATGSGGVANAGGESGWGCAGSGATSGVADVLSSGWLVAGGCANGWFGSIKIFLKLVSIDILAQALTLVWSDPL